ncbi:helix-turn-helix domain-containing protein [Echinicola shivajiensis]|uniref:helix-turn-helix domain-containing protein n=1 Tax=Echinicola shivajiensis TaxID=1035916 RepID=UPI001FE76AA4|nr:helix-turn-helix transcriptional regulator [Echinicola shivajiensis]
MNDTTMPEKIHHGRNVKRFREMMGIKQEALAHELGDDWSQKKVSLLEQKETIEDDLLKQVAAVLKVPEEALKNFSEEAAINIIASTLHDNAGSINNNCTLNFNPIDKLIEVYEENKRLYERLLASEKEKNELLKGKK